MPRKDGSKKVLCNARVVVIASPDLSGRGNLMFWVLVFSASFGIGALSFDIVLGVSDMMLGI